MPGVGFWDRKYGGAKHPVVGGVNAWLDALGYQPVVEHAFTPVVIRLSEGRVVRRVTEDKKRGSYIPNSLLKRGNYIPNSLLRCYCSAEKIGRGRERGYMFLSRVCRVPPLPLQICS